MDPIEANLEQLTAYLLEQAEASPNGRVAQPVHLGHETLRITAIGFAAGAELPEHDNPGEAVLQVLHGTVVLTSDEPVTVGGRALQGGRTIEATPGLLVRIPDTRHKLNALEPSVILLTQVPLTAM